jgi:hypothetical protein
LAYGFDRLLAPARHHWPLALLDSHRIQNFWSGLSVGDHPVIKRRRFWSYASFRHHLIIVPLFEQIDVRS